MNEIEYSKAVKEAELCKSCLVKYCRVRNTKIRALKLDDFPLNKECKIYCKEKFESGYFNGSGDGMGNYWCDYICPFCGYEGHEDTSMDSTNCKNCNSYLYNEHFKYYKDQNKIPCLHCKQELEKTMKYCYNCGKEVAQSE